MKILMIGGTGNISSFVTELCLKKGEEVVLLNRGNKQTPEGARSIIADIHDEEAVKKAIEEESFDVVANFIAYAKEDVERDIRLFSGKTKQYIFISSASAYQRPLSNCFVTESTPLCNPYWKYSRDKIDCEERLMKEYRDNGFPVTIIRPSHTYGHFWPVAMSGDNGCWQVIKRLKEGKPLILHADGLSLWTVTHSSDVAKGIYGLMGNIHALGEAVHITSDEVLTWNQIYKIMGNCLGVEPNLKYLATSTIVKHNPSREGQLFGDMANSAIYDNSKIKKLVPDFCATVRFDQGAKMALEYIMEHEEMHVEDEAFDKECDFLANLIDNM